MAKVTNSVSTKYRVMGLEEDEAPLHDNTEGEQLIKDLLRKQTCTQTSLTEQMLMNKQFISSTELVDLAKYPQGECSFKHFSERSKHIDQVQKLKSQGLSDSDIQIAIDLHYGEEYVKKKYKMLESMALNERLTAIKKTLAEKDVDDNKSEHFSSRHEKELQSIEVHSGSKKLLQFANFCKYSQKMAANDINLYPHDHPMNSLPSIEHELFDHLKKKTRKRKQGKRDRQSHVLESTDVRKQPVIEIQAEQIPSSGYTSQWDKKEAPLACSSSSSLPLQSSSSITKHVHSCSPQTWYAIEKNKLVFLGCNNKLGEDVSKNEKNTALTGKHFVAPASTSLLIPMKDILSNRLSVEEIKQIPKFSNYQEGSMSKTIFIKNLASSVKEDDLVRLFGHFEDLNYQNARIMYRLMGGKMKGQAFVTFPSINNAQKALNTVNGFKLKDRPVILQFGKKN